MLAKSLGIVSLIKSYPNKKNYIVNINLYSSFIS